MTFNRNLEHILGRVRLEDLIAYMQKLGWYRVPSHSTKRQIFRLSKHDKMELILPKSSTLQGASRGIKNTIQTLSQIHEISAEQIAAAIVNEQSDSMLIRLNIPESMNSIPMEDAPRHIKAIRNLVLYSACAEIDPKPYYDEPPAGSLGLVKSFEFCHTFQGSFGFEVSASISTPSITSDLFEPPKQRKIIERIAKGLELLEHAVQVSDPSKLIFAYSTALNSKMCDAIADISLDGKIPYNLDIEWASALTPSDDVKNFKSQKISAPQVEMLRFVSEQLKIVKPRTDEILGQVINLHCLENPTKDNSKRTVAVKTTHDVHGKIEVRMNLGPELYIRAVDAHSSGLRVLAKGKLQRKGSSWTLDSVNKLDLVGSTS